MWGALRRLLTSTFLLAHLMAQDLIRQVPAMLSHVQNSPAMIKEVARREVERMLGPDSTLHSSGLLAGKEPLPVLYGKF